MANKPSAKTPDQARKGYVIRQSSDLKPFINWDEQPEVEGALSNFREVDGDFGTQEVCDVGDFSVGITTALHGLKKLEGKTVLIVYDGEKESKKGRMFKSFTIYEKETPNRA